MSTVVGGDADLLVSGLVLQLLDGEARGLVSSLTVAKLLTLSSSKDYK